MFGARMQPLENLNYIFDCVADGVVAIDSDFIVTYMNRAAENLTGRPAMEGLGKPCSEVLRCDVCREGCPVAEAMETGHPVVNREFELLPRQGGALSVSVTASPVHGKGQELEGGVLTFRDISLQPAERAKISEHYAFFDIISRNLGMRRLFDILPDIAASDATVLFYGESGTGKELFAQAIHQLSPRKDGPLVIVNCGALPEPLLEAEIFGSRRGAYTGSVENRPGRLAMAEGGTLFLDEIGDLPLPLQVKLLRVLESYEFQPLGAAHPQKANVRFVAATHRDLPAMVEEGSFRRDLYFRLNVVSLQIPPLRDRRDDIPLLVDLFIDRFNRAFHKKLRGVSPEVCRLLLDHDYPGNVRELLNLVEQSVILCRDNEIGLDNLPAAFLSSVASKEPTRYFKTRRPDREALSEVLLKHHGRRNEVAEELGIDRTTLWRWIKRMDIKTS